MRIAMKNFRLIAVLLLLLAGCGDGSTGHPLKGDASDSATRKSACGRIGRLVLHLPSTDSFVGMTFDGNDHWVGGTRAPRGSTCDDRLRQASIALTWPEMLPTGASPGLPRVGGKETIILTFVPYDPRVVRGQELQREAIQSIDFSKPDAAWRLATEKKRIDPASGLHCMEGRSSVADRDVCWNEGMGDGISTLVVCNRRSKEDPPLCRQVLLRPRDRVRTEVRYEGALRPQWRLIERRAGEFLEDHAISKSNGQ
jgi:hypothetical protein